MTGLSKSTIFLIRQGRYDEGSVLRRYGEPMSACEPQSAEVDNQDVRPVQHPVEGGAVEPEANEHLANNHLDTQRTPETSDEDREVAWCPQCRCHIFPPCQLCRARKHRRRILGARAARRPRPSLAESTDERTLARLRLSVTELGLPIRTANFLQRAGIESVNDLLHCTKSELLELPHFAGKTVEQIYRSLARLGFIARVVSQSRPSDP